MRILRGHWKALGTTTRERVRVFACCYGISVGIAATVWQVCDRSLSKDALGILATVDSVVATVLLTVMGSIYSGLPGAVRRSRFAHSTAQKASEAVLHDDVVDVGKEMLGPKYRARVESARLDVLTGLFSHTATAVVYALISLPIVVAAIQVRESSGEIAQCLARWFTLAVLCFSCTTLMVMFLVLLHIYRLVMADVNDPDPI